MNNQFVTKTAATITYGNEDSDDSWSKDIELCVISQIPCPVHTFFIEVVRMKVVDVQ